MSTHSSAISGTGLATASVPARTVASLTAAMLGVLLVWVVGFAGSDMLHAAAHDTRHAVSFPCH